MLLLLLLAFLVHLLGLGARDVPKDTKYVIKKITSCPDVGYYFRREVSPNSLQPGPCFLCFCQDDGTAICWKRENKRCDVSSYQHRGIGKRDTRVRRSPFGLSDIFFRDAARDLFNKNTPQTCKPFETSFSEGCPPADWCVGCSVCDCDAHGHWDCHILSFCPDEKDKSIMRTAKKSLKKPSKTQANAIKALTKQPTRTTTTTKSPKPVKTHVKTNKIQNKTGPRRPNRQAKNTNASKTKPQQKRNNNIRKNNMNASPKPLIIKKNVATRKPVILKTTKNHIKLNATDREFITQEVVKRVVNVMQRMLNRSQIINNQLLSILPNPKTIQKRSMDKKKPQSFRKNVKKYRPATSNKSRYSKPLSPKRNQGANRTRPKRSGPHRAQRKNERYKRNILDNVTETYQMSNASNTETHANFENEVLNKSTTVDNYYKYALVTHIPNNDTTLKNNEESYNLIHIDGFNDTNRRQISPERIKQRIYLMAKKYQSSQKSNISILNEVTTKDMQNHDVKIFTQNSREFDLLNYRKAYVTSKPINNVIVILTNNLTTNKIKVHYKDAERQVRPHPKKYNSSQIVNTLNNERKMLNISNPSMASNIKKSFKTQVYKKIVDIQNVLKRLLNEFHSNKTKLMKPKRTRFNIFKYVKKFFKNIFWKRNTKVELLNNSAYEKKKLKSHIIQAVCEVFGNCHIKKSVNKLIEPKISELHFETNKILRIIKIIKGLLHLIDFPSTLQNETDKIYFKDDISKLNYILKNQYNTSEKVLTQNQITQINYLKNNVDLFIQAVGKFANILNEIITILTNKHAHNKIDVRNRRNTKIDNFSNVTRNFTVTKHFDKLKDLLKKYKLVQNTFIKKMYDVLSKFEKSQNNSSMRKVSYEHNDAVNTTVRTENISRNIIKNLRKLKNLAEMLNSNQRKKRDVMREDDTIEYLLTLMEFMLKQNYPLDAAPVNDGIDLLIEAIKNAPDIKPIEKKVLKTAPSNVGRNSITEAPPTYLNTSQDESISDSNKDSAEDNVNVTLNPDGTRPKDSEQDKEYKNEETEKSMLLYNTESVFYDGNYPTAQNPNEVIDTTLSYQSEKITDNEESIGDKMENEIKNVRKFDIFSGDLEDDDSDRVNDSDMEVTSRATDKVRSISEADSAVESRTVRVVAETTEFKLPAVKLRQYNINNKDIAESSSGGNDKRVAFDWLDERYEQDVKEAMEGREVKSNPENITKTQTTARAYTSSDMPILQRHSDNISSMTKELSDEEKSRQTLNTEEVMYKKQMDLLNSLDYGTEKSELEDAELKEEKEEAFMSYYS